MLGQVWRLGHMVSDFNAENACCDLHADSRGRVRVRFHYNPPRLGSPSKLATPPVRHWLCTPSVRVGPAGATAKACWSAHGAAPPGHEFDARRAAVPQELLPLRSTCCFEVYLQHAFSVLTSCRHSCKKDPTRPKRWATGLMCECRRPSPMGDQWTRQP